MKKLKRVQAGFYIFTTGVLVSRVIKIHHCKWIVSHFRNNKRIGGESPVETLDVAAQIVYLKHAEAK